MNQKVRAKGVYLLPNLFTISGLFAGFYAIIAAMKGMFDTASLAVFIAMVADVLDGRVARLTNTESAFGAQFDSLSDLIAFGLAPALLLYSWCLVRFHKLGWLVAFFYLASTALRLARYNVEESSQKYFKGLPCPAAAGLIAGMVWFFDVNQLQFSPVYYLSAVIMVVAAFLMVSSVQYYHIKHLDFKGKVPYFFMLLAVLVVIVITLEPAQVLFLAFLIYTLSGVITTLYAHQKEQPLDSPAEESKLTMINDE